MSAMEHFKLYLLLDGSTPVDNDSEGENLLENSSTPHEYEETDQPLVESEQV